MLDSGVELVPGTGAGPRPVTGVELVPGTDAGPGPETCTDAGPGPVTGGICVLGSAVGKVLTWPVAGIGGWAVTGVSLVPTLTD